MFPSGARRYPIATTARGGGEESIAKRVLAKRECHSPARREDGEL